MNNIQNNIKIRKRKEEELVLLRAKCKVTLYKIAQSEKEEKRRTLAFLKDQRTYMNTRDKKATYYKGKSLKEQL